MGWRCCPSADLGLCCAGVVNCVARLFWLAEWLPKLIFLSARNMRFIFGGTDRLWDQATFPWVQFPYVSGHQLRVFKAQFWLFFLYWAGISLRLYWGKNCLQKKSLKQSMTSLRCAKTARHQNDIEFSGPYWQSQSCSSSDHQFFFNVTQVFLVFF